MSGTYWIESLGCPKNQVDSDKVAGTLLAGGLLPATAPDGHQLALGEWLKPQPRAEVKCVNQGTQVAMLPMIMPMAKARNRKMKSGKFSVSTGLPGRYSNQT